MDTFRGMITDNTKCKELNYHLLTHEDVIKLNIVPNNIVQDHSARYLNWIEYNGKLYHHKMFDLNDFIGSNLCKVINLRSAKYDLAMVKGYIQTISESFIEENKKYYNLKNIIGAYKRGISYANVNLRDFVTFLEENNFKAENINDLIDQLLKMAAVDYYMKQRDRLYNNYMFEVENNQISLAPLYDFGNGFNFADSDYLYYDCLMGFEYQYFNELVPINVYVFDFLVQQYPQLKEYLNSLTKVDLLGLIKDICNRYNLVLTNELEQIYKEEENDSKIRIKSLL